MALLKELICHFENLCGEKVENNNLEISVFDENAGLGYSQFNEILL